MDDTLRGADGNAIVVYEGGSLDIDCGDFKDTAGNTIPPTEIRWQLNRLDTESVVDGLSFEDGLLAPKELVTAELRGDDLAIFANDNGWRTLTFKVLYGSDGVIIRPNHFQITKVAAIPNQ